MLPPEVTSIEGGEVFGASDIDMSLPSTLVSHGGILTKSLGVLLFGRTRTFTLYLLVLPDSLLMDVSMGYSPSFEGRTSRAHR